MPSRRWAMSDPLGGARWRVDEGDCLPWLAEPLAGSVDCCVTSPPCLTLTLKYGILTS